MLKTSPVLSGPNTASPTSFRRGHATPRSPLGSPRPSISAARRKASLTSSPGLVAKSPHQPRAKPQEASADSKIDDFIRSVAQENEQRAHSPRPQATIASTVSDSAAGGVSSDTEQPQTSTAPEADQQPVLSPNKRRVSSGLRDDNGTARTDGEGQDQPSPSTVTAAPKRARTDGQPPKVLPLQYEHCAVEDIVELIAHMLAELITTNDAIRISSGGLTRFHSRTAPGISVRDYLHRLAKHATLTPPLLLAMVYYIDRLCAMYPEFTINTLTVHRFLITAVTVAAKGLSDSFWNNTTYARVGGVRVAELKMLELEFLYRVDWKIVPNPEVLVAYYRGLIDRTPQYTLESEDSSGDELVDDDDEQKEQTESSAMTQ